MCVSEDTMWERGRNRPERRGEGGESVMLFEKRVNMSLEMCAQFSQSIRSKSFKRFPLSSFLKQCHPVFNETPRSFFFFSFSSFSFFFSCLFYLILLIHSPVPVSLCSTCSVLCSWAAEKVTPLHSPVRPCSN